MKRIAIILCTLLVTALQLSAQIKTRNSRDSISINGIKFGYIYTIEQLKEALGEPTQINTHPADDYGYNHYIRFGGDLVTTIRSECNPLSFN